jgi:hypothetical protein
MVTDLKRTLNRKKEKREKKIVVYIFRRKIEIKEKRTIILL